MLHVSHRKARRRLVLLSCFGLGLLGTLNAYLVISGHSDFARLSEYPFDSASNEFKPWVPPPAWKDPTFRTPQQPIRW